jgi:hypothetical protein
MRLTIQKNQLNMKHFDEWAKGKNPILAKLALSFASYADYLYESIGSIKKQERPEGYIPLPSPEEWLGFYRKHRQIYQSLADALKPLNAELGKNINSYCLLLNELKSFKGPKREKAIEVLKNLKPEERQNVFDIIKKDEKYKNMQELFMTDIVNEDIKVEYTDDEEKKRIKENLTSPEMLFFMNVWAPCLMLYGAYPPTLLRSARHGDINAIEKLARLDKTIISDSRIMKLYHQASRDKNRETFNRITKALDSVPRMKADRRKIKFYLAGLISNISNELGQKMPASDINLLYDAIARDRGIDNIDTDFIDLNPEAFEKGIQRARKMWHIPSIADKK